MEITKFRDRIIFETFVDFLILVTEAKVGAQDYEYFQKLDNLVKHSFMKLDEKEKEKIKSQLVSNIKLRLQENEKFIKKSYGDQEYEKFSQELIDSIMK